MINRVDREATNKQFVVRRSNRLSHNSYEGPPCGFLLKIVDFDELSRHTDDSKLDIVEEMSSIAGTPEARARNKLIDKQGEHLEIKKHTKYTYEYYKVNLGDLILLEWFRRDWNSARAYLEGGFDALLRHCRKLEEVLEDLFPEPAEVYDHISPGNGIHTAYRQVHRFLSKEVLEEDLDLKTAHVIARLGSDLTIKPSSEILEILGISLRPYEKIDLYDFYRKKTSELLEPLREVIPIVEERTTDRKKQIIEVIFTPFSFVKERLKEHENKEEELDNPEGEVKEKSVESGKAKVKKVSQRKKAKDRLNTSMD